MAYPLPYPPSYTTEFVIIDEAHERTIPTDLLLALLKGALPLLSDLKVGFEDGFSKGPPTLAAAENPGGAQVFQPAWEFQPTQAQVPAKPKQPLKRGDSMTLQYVTRNSRRGNQTSDLRAISNSSCANLLIR
ncbi:hypothetical protein FOXG_21279 [Fusarium oxysporum f. sp. lycopersici 4287]|uniref:Helicase ATP-binding domain-containing protein n=1 Tax=Fusarium oxysporum f. sp. lycopersici (strain 4287 / CBS 123668 / FGSC 9935 / NRRL 34936) TaxID=426428 RepID=A0A0J9WT10_FUSO4|nr:hypothetical protein FOXG_21279 [Fusarium oxysporum f. sp. lycopersici 4287]KNB15217.1 hypothetical protein FOXG_21279 [Fusarium oxysporum f. sp. lycopersici 4287]